MRRLSPRRAVVTGDAAGGAADDEAGGGGTVGDEAAEPAPSTVEARRQDELRARPLLVFVHTDPNACDGKCEGACQRYFDADEEVFGDEKVSLGSRAFRRLWMTPEDAAKEPLLANTTEHLPRLVILDIARDASVVVHGKGLKAKRFYGQLKKASDRFYRERLDGIVRKHLKMLGTYDKLAQRESAIQERLTRTKDLRKVHDLEDDLDGLRDERQELDRKVEDLWDLSLRDL